MKKTLCVVALTFAVVSPAFAQGYRIWKFSSLFRLQRANLDSKISQRRPLRFQNCELAELESHMRLPCAFADDAKKIAQHLDDKWLEAFDMKDAAALPGLYTTVLLPRRVDEAIIGTENIRKFMDQMTKETLENMVLPVTQANVLDPTSLYQADAWAAHAGGQHVTGTYMSVVLQDGAS